MLTKNTELPAYTKVGPTGNIFLTLQSPSTGTLDIYAYNVTSGALATMLSNGGHNMTAAFSHDGKMVAFSHRGGPSLWQIYIANADGSGSRQITTDSNRFKREPVWSYDGRQLAYSVEQENPNLNPLAPNSWEVYLSDLTNAPVFLGLGIDSFFSPDGRTLYVLQNDGLHAINLTKVSMAGNTAGVPLPFPSQLVESTLVMGSSTMASQTMKISVSPDGTHLAWSAPTLGLVRIYKITSWAPFIIEPEKDLQVTAYYSAFSPDSQYLALQEVDLDVNGLPTNARVVTYHLGDYQPVTKLDLSQYPVSYVFLTAWQ
jgi:WD40 repeat protein